MEASEDRRMSKPPMIRRKVQLRDIPGREPSDQAATPIAGRVPRVSRLLALAYYIDRLIERGEVVGYAQLARQFHLSRARIAQVMKLRYLAPDLQEMILHLPPVHRGADPITERDLRPIVAQPDWRRQRQMWSRQIGKRLS
jgi:hypothetical protein